jgi:hypothetical protein
MQSSGGCASTAMQDYQNKAFFLFTKSKELPFQVLAIGCKQPVHFKNLTNHITIQQQNYPNDCNFL